MKICNLNKFKKTYKNVSKIINSYILLITLTDRWYIGLLNIISKLQKKIQLVFTYGFYKSSEGLKYDKKKNKIDCFHLHNFCKMKQKESIMNFFKDCFFFFSYMIIVKHAPVCCIKITLKYLYFKSWK